MKMNGKSTWKPAPNRPPMLANARMGIGPAAVAVPLGWRLLTTWGIPLVLGAGAIYATGAIAKSAVPELPINKKSIGRAALLGGSGISAYYLSDLLPQDWKPVAYIAAVAGITGALYYLFSEPALEPPPQILPTAQIAPNLQVPAIAPGPLADAMTVYVDPEQPNTGGSHRWPWGDQEYEVIVKNNLSKPFSFFVGTAINQEDEPVQWRSPAVDPRYGRQRIDLAPNEDRSVKLKIPSSAVGITKNYGVSFEFFRERDALPRDAFRVSPAIPVFYSFYPQVFG